MLQPTVHATCAAALRLPRCRAALQDHTLAKLSPTMNNSPDQLDRLLQQATDIIADLHNLYLLHTGQVDNQFQCSFPPLPPPPSFTIPLPSPTSSCDSAPVHRHSPAPRKPAASLDSSSPSPTPQPKKRRQPAPPLNSQANWDDLFLHIPHQPSPPLPHRQRKHRQQHLTHHIQKQIFLTLHRHITLHKLQLRILQQRRGESTVRTGIRNPSFSRRAAGNNRREREARFQRHDSTFVISCPLITTGIQPRISDGALTILQPYALELSFVSFFRQIMASDRAATAAGIAYDPVISNNHHLTSQPTPHPTAAAAFTAQAPNKRFLPGNGPIHLAPSITHQPELLLLSWMLDTLSMLVRHIMEHPLSAGPTPDPTMFVDNNAYRLFYQLQLTLTDLGRATLRLIRAQRLLQFLPGPPGQSGQYRVDPTAQFPPHPTDFLSTEPLTPPQSPARSHRRSHFPSSPSYTTTTSTRERSRSRDRHNYRQPTADAADLLSAADDSGTLDATRDSHLSNHATKTVP